MGPYHHGGTSRNTANLDMVGVTNLESLDQQVAKAG